MEMMNATAGGPSYGIFDVLFGKKPQEEPKEGQGFEPLLNLVKALKAKSEEGAAENGWTRTETEVGKKAEEYRFVTAPAMYAPSSQSIDLQKVMPSQEEIAQLSPAQLKQLVAGKLKAMQQQQATPLQAVERPDEMSEVLRQMARGAEEPVEAKLMKTAPEVQEMSQAIDSRIKELARQILAQDSPKPVEGLKERALAAAAGMEALQSEAAKRQLNLQAAEVTQASAEMPKASKLPVSEKKLSNEKMFTTEDFLQVKDNGQKGADAPKAEAVMAKPEVQADVQPDVKQNPAHNLMNQSEQSELMSVKPEVQKPQPLKSKAADLKKDIDVNQASLPGDLTLKASAGLAVREVFISDAKPEHVRERLVGEVAQSVGIQVKNGGGEMKLVIHPEHMGELKLKVGTKDGKVQVAVTADNNEVAQSLRASQSDLHEALTGQNLTLSKFEVHVASDSSMASNQDNGGYQNPLFQENGDKSNGGKFSDQNARDNGSNYREESARMGDALNIPKPKATAYKASNGGKSRLDVVA